LIDDWRLTSGLLIDDWRSYEILKTYFTGQAVGFIIDDW